MRVLVTGGAGFIGSHLVEYYLGRGDEVHVIDDLSTGSLRNIEPFKKIPAFKFIEGEILTTDKLAEEIAWSERIFHMAAIVGMYRVIADPIATLTSNIMTTERLLKTIAEAKHKPRLIVASSSEAYGYTNKEKMCEEDNLVIEAKTHPRWYYAFSKVTDEALVFAYCNAFNLPATLVRFFNVIGPRQTGRYGFVAPRFVQQALKKEPLTIFGDGEQTRCFCDVRDAVEVMTRLAERDDLDGQVVNVGNDRQVTINELASIVQQRLATDAGVSHTPFKEAYSDDYVEVQHRRPDLQKMKNLTGYDLQWTLEQTIDSIAEYESKLL